MTRDHTRDERSPARAWGTVLRLSLRSLRSSAPRQFLSVLAIAVAVAFLTSTQMLISVLNTTASSMMSSGYEGVDVVIRPGQGSTELDPSFPDRIASLQDVSSVSVDDRRTVSVTLPDGTPADTAGHRVHLEPWPINGKGSTRGQSQIPGESSAGEGSGEDPTVSGSGEAYIPASTVQGDLHPGSIVVVEDSTGDYSLALQDPPEGGGTAGTGGTPGTDGTAGGGGDIAVYLPAGEYMARYGADGVPEIHVAVAGSSGAESVAASVSALLTSPDAPAPDVRTGAELVAEAEKTTRDTIGFIPYLLYAFVGTALLATAFTIFNTFTTTVVRRQRDTALLRSLGMTRGQTVAAILIEALSCAVAGSAAGVVVGLLVVRSVVPAVGRRLSDVSLTVPELTVVSVALPVAVGVGVTLAGALLPALRAGRVSATEALRRSGAPRRGPRWGRVLVGLMLLTAALALCLAGRLLSGAGTGARVGLAGVGTVAGFAGVYLVSPAVLHGLVTVMVPVVSALTRRLPVSGAALRLAVAQGRRDPARTAGTAFALTLGLALTTVTGSLGASVVNGVTTAVDSEVTADLVVSSADGLTGEPVPGPAVSAVQDAPGVASTYTVGKAPLIVGTAGDGVVLASVSDGDPTTALDVGETEGTTDLSDGEGVTMSASFARQHGWTVGDTVDIAVPGQPASAPMPLVGTYGHSRLLGDVVVSSTAFWKLAPGSRGLGGHRTLAVAVTGDGSQDAATLREGIAGAVSRYPAVDVQTPQEFAGQQTKLVDRFTALVYALCALAVLVAVAGVANTLALSVVERRREIGMLRAVGASRGFVRRTLTAEAVLTSVYGAVVGVVTGLAAGYGLQGALGGVGLTALVVPGGLVLGVLVGSVVVGVVSAVVPAVRAARIPPLDAVED